MPPRKKATADGSAPVPIRSSSRNKNKAASTTQPDVTDAAPDPAVVDTAVKAPAKRKSKRARADSTSDDAPAAKPTSKRAKKAKQDDVVDAKEDDGAVIPADDEPAEEQKKMVTVIKRGAAPVDPVSGLVATHQVYSNDEGVWDAMLNQTDVSGNQNKNKFYVLQLLHPIGNPSSCALFTRWGRVGENGQCQTKGSWASSVAISEFKKQFKSKTACAWEVRHGMVPRKGKYTWLERDYNDEDDTEKGKEAGSSKKEDIVIPDSTLASEIQDLCRLIFSTSIIDAHLSSMNYDANKLPLGKLAKSTILNGFAALKTLAEVIQNPVGDRAKEYGGARAACEHLSSAYYSIIPHDFGRQRPIVIDNSDHLKKELDLVDALGDMEIASKLISSTILSDELGNPINSLDAHFRSLGLSSMDPVKKDTKEFENLVAYARDTHGATHRYKVALKHAFRVERAGETEAWHAKGHEKLGDGERLLLWHGSRTTNFAGILKQGLRIAPPEAPVTGYMFGKGVYFADMMTKSANYCYSYLSNDTGLLLLCEVAARPFYELTAGSYDADRECKENNKMSTKGIGRTQPVKWKDAGEALGHDGLVGCHMPAGPGQDVGPTDIYLQYNEYIVYDPSQIRLSAMLYTRGFWNQNAGPGVG
ncbi:poly polymerase catalytic domain-containing protein [Flammula alnicola]|nr:poly polymerase catalytic domain-containing protein [Flammula alnicola]